MNETRKGTANQRLHRFQRQKLRLQKINDCEAEAEEVLCTVDFLVHPFIPINT